jgi:hypothetical protein
VPDRLPVVPGTVADVADLHLVHLPIRSNGEVIDWTVPIRKAWNISESAALNIMEQFMAEGGLHSFTMLIPETLASVSSKRSSCNVPAFLLIWEKEKVTMAV